MATYISGLTSGLDWQSVISDLMAIERRPITLLEERKTALEAQKSAWREVNTKLNSLMSAAQALSSSDDFEVYSGQAAISGSSKSVSDILDYAVGTNASQGSYSITVNRLAQAQKFASAAFASDDTELGISGTVTLNGRDLTIDATDTLADIRDKINALNSGDDPAGVTASIIKVADDEYRLTVASKETGASGIDIVDGSGVFSSGLGMNETVSGQDAEIVVEGFTITRSSNLISDVIAGVTLNLKGADESATITLTVSRDNSGVKDKIESFVSAYNDLMSYIDDQNTVAGDTEKPLYADSSLAQLKKTIRNAILSGVDGLSSTLDHLSLIGVNIDRYGKLSIDDDTLEGYLETNFEDVVSLFSADGLTYETTGVASRLEEAIDAMTDSIDGYVVTRQESLQSQMDKLDRKIEDMEERLERKQKALESKFVAMETMLSTLQAQQDWLSSQISTLVSK